MIDARNHLQITCCPTVTSALLLFSQLILLVSPSVSLLRVCQACFMPPYLSHASWVPSLVPSLHAPPPHSLSSTPRQGASSTTPCCLVPVGASPWRRWRPALALSSISRSLELRGLNVCDGCLGGRRRECVMPLLVPMKLNGSGGHLKEKWFALLLDVKGHYCINYL